MFVHLRKKGQSTVEYVILFIVLMGALLTMQSYIKRGLQGRWKESMDDFGDQYDPKFANASVIHTVYSNSSTELRRVAGRVGGQPGFWTNRFDKSSSIETKDGFISVGAEK